MSYRCESCNKEFKTLSGQWKHNNKYHTNEYNQKVTNNNHNNNHIITTNNHIININTDNKLKCKYCNKHFNFKQNTWRHEKSCKKNINSNNNINKIKELENKLMDEIGKIKNNSIKTTNITNNILTNNNLIGNTVNIANIGNENINDLSKYEQLKILNDKNYALTTFIDNMYFNSRLPNNHKFYNSAINDKHINVIENNKIVKKKKTEVYDIMFTPCVKMIENIIIANKKDIKYKQFQECKEIIEFYHSMPIHKKLMKAYHDEVNMMSYNKKDLILNTLALSFSFVLKNFKIIFF